MSSFTFSIAFSLTVCALAALLALSLAVALIHKFRSSSHEDFKQFPFWTKMTRVSAVAIFVNLFLCTLSIVMLMIAQSSADHIYTQRDPVAKACRALFFAFLKLWYASSYIFMLARLISTFQDSVYAVTNAIIYVHVAFICFFLISQYIVYSLIMMNTGILFELLLPLNVGFYIVGLIHLSYEFNHRLFQLIVSQRQTIVACSGERSLSATQHRILTVIRKNTLLASIQAVAIFSTATVYTVAVILTDFNYWPFSTYPLADAYIAVLDAAKLSVFFVSSMSVYLGFQVNKREYVTLCRACDKKCESCYEKIAHRRINQHLVETGSVDMSLSPSSKREQQGSM